MPEASPNPEMPSVNPEDRLKDVFRKGSLRQALKNDSLVQLRQRIRDLHALYPNAEPPILIQYFTKDPSKSRLEPDEPYWFGALYNVLATPRGITLLKPNVIIPDGCLGPENIPQLEDIPTFSITEADIAWENLPPTVTAT